VIRARKERLPVKCPHCDYTCRGTQALGRHIHYTHPETLRVPRISLRPDTLQDLLGLLEKSVSDEQLRAASDGLSSAVRSQALRLQLTVLSIAVAKAERVIQLDSLIDRLSRAVESKLTPELLAMYPPGALLEFRERLTALENADAEYIKSILEMKSGGETAFFVKVTELLRSAVGDERTREQLAGVLRVESSALSPGAITDLDRLVQGILQSARVTSQLKSAKDESSTSQSR
jgi:hypothetical protein